MLKNHIFSQALRYHGINSRYGAYLCMDCMQKGLGRKLSLRDLLIVPWNINYIMKYFPHTDVSWLSKKLVAFSKYLYYHNKRAIEIATGK